MQFSLNEVQKEIQENSTKILKDNIDLFNAKDLYDSRGKYKKIAELKSQITSLIDALKRQQNQS